MPLPGTSPSPILVAGKVATYTGTDVTAHVYASPGPTQSNYTAGYSFTVTTTTNAAAAGAPAPFDVNSVTTYTTTQAPTAGLQHTSTVTDSFENQSTSGANVAVTLAASKSVTIGNDVTGGNAGGGPYTETTTSTTTYATPRTLGVYPLVAGSLTEPLAKTVANATTDANAGGTQPSDTFVASLSQTFANDGSFTRNEQISNGEQDVLSETSSGTATDSESGPIFSLQIGIGAPVQGTTGFTIPVTSTRQNATLGATPAPTATTAAFSAADWYPGNALPKQPLESDVLTVKGPVTTLPSACSGALSEPNVVEVDETIATLDVDANDTSETLQRFDSNGTNVCVLRTTTTQDYALDTGLLSQTSTETYAQILTSLKAGTAATVQSSLPRH